MPVNAQITRIESLDERSVAAFTRPVPLDTTSLMRSIVICLTTGVMVLTDRSLNHGSTVLRRMSWRTSSPFTENGSNVHIKP